MFEVDTEEVYFTGVDVRSNVIRVPTEIIRIVGNETGPPISISAYYRNIFGLLPGTLLGGNDSILASSVLSTSLQCGQRICDTSNIELSLPVIITLQHTSYIQVWSDNYCNLYSHLDMQLKFYLCLQDLIKHDVESIVTCVFWEFITVE